MNIRIVHVQAVTNAQRSGECGTSREEVTDFLRDEFDIDLHTAQAMADEFMEMDDAYRSA